MDHFFTENLITTKDAGELSGYTSDYLARLVRSGKIVGKRIGHSWLIDKTSLTHFLGNQENNKIVRSRELAQTRAKEYQQHHQLTHRLARTLTTELPVPQLGLAGVSLRSHALSLSLALAVVASGAVAARAATLPQLTEQIASVAHEVAFGFDATFGTIPARLVSKIDDAEITLRDNAPRVALASVRDAFDAPLLITKINLTSLQGVVVKEYRAPRATAALASSVRAGVVVPTVEDVRASVLEMYAFVTTPSRIAHAVADAHLALGMNVHAGINRSLLSYRDLIEASGVRALALAATTRDTLAATPRVIVTLVGNLGDTLARSTARVPALATDSYLRATAAPATIAPALAQAVFGAEYAAASRFVAVTNDASDRYLAFIENAGSATYVGVENTRALARATHSAVARAPATLEDAYLGALGKSAAALDAARHVQPVAAALVAVAPALSLGEQAALATYETIRSVFDVTTDALATLFTPAPIPTTPARVPTKLAVATSTPVRTNVTAYSYPNYTTVVQGVSADFVNQSLASLRADILATAASMIQPVAAQGVTNMTTIQQVNMIQDLSNLIVRNGDFRGGTFNGGSVSGATSVSATTGTFTNLVASATSLATTTITGSLTLTGDQTITGNLTISALTLTGSLSTPGSVSATNFIATSTTATSTFAGPLAASAYIWSPYFVATSATATSTFAGALAVTGATSLTSLTATDATLTNATATNATSTSLYVSGTASTTNLNANTATIASVTGGEGSFGSTTVTATSTTQGLAAVFGFFDSLFATATHIVTGTIDTLTSTLASLDPLTSRVATLYDATIGTLTATSTATFYGGITANTLTATSSLDVKTLTASTTDISTTLSVGGLATFTGGFLSNASSTITSGLFSMNGGASTTNLTASGTGYFGSLGGAVVSALTANYLPKWSSGTFTNSLIADDGAHISFPYASTTQLSAYGSLVVGGTSTTTLAGDGNTSTIYGPLAVRGTSTQASSLTLQRGNSNGDNSLIFNDQNGSPLLKLYTNANTGSSYLNGYQNYLSLGTLVGGETLRLDTGHIVTATADIVPSANQTYNLGAPATYWNNAYINNIVANNLSSASTSIAGTNTSSFSINSNNPTSDTQDMSLIFYRGAGASSNAVLSWNSVLKRLEMNQNLYVINDAASPASTTLTLKAVAGQTGNLTSWLDSAGASLASLSATGDLTISGDTAP